MILRLSYDSLSLTRPFDDRLMQMVDKTIDLTLESNRPEARHQLSEQQYIRDHKTLFMRLPRQVGKTTYLTKLHTKLYMDGFNPLYYHP